MSSVRVWRVLIAFFILSITFSHSAWSAKPSSVAALKRLQNSAWVQDGKTTAPQVVYMFTDMNCPYCTVMWNRLRPWVNSGKVQVRHIVLGVIRPSSMAKGVAVLEDKNPQMALFNHEKAIMTFLGTGKVKGVPDHIGIKATKKMSNSGIAKLQANAVLAESMGVSGTPAIFWLDADGDVSAIRGLVDGDVLTQVFGKP